MPILKRRNPAVPDGPGIVGPARLCRGPADLSSVRSGDVVVLDQVDLEADTAQSLVDRGVAAVLNVSPSSSGRYPNLGPQVLVDAGVLLVDRVGEGVWQTLRSGDVVRVDEGTVLLGEDTIATGIEMTPSRVRDQVESASSGLSHQLDSIVTNAADTLRRDRAMLLEGAGIPAVATAIKDRPVVIVADAPDAARDLKSIRAFIHDKDPVLIGVGAGAEHLIAAGLRPHLLVGRADDISGRMIERSAEVVIVSASGHLDRPEQFEAHGRQPVVFTAAGAPENLAVLLADHHEAAVIVQVGRPSRLVDIVDGDAADAAGTFIARLRAGSRVVDAHAVAWFARQRLSWLTPLLLLLAGVVAVVVAVGTTPLGHEWLAPVTDRVSSWIEGLFS
ncbi:putative cytokinetic ring protein SteA [Aeromicrobium duanguangcaii]|uniref:Cytokinetic ring protein SteA n=1 Tax=Aeromicrobium duanguangcaii TaxID=2968086 RepID=A0ABY5KEY4_9ACTN|nr:putative cytokinetic ring protein SteA [Aeromicrobium duanguangcaii]MCL3837514.1 putative cytokinetic ring protein SteA [Aeromicrobium duanguangcaii]UUI67536.1 putative cytokinetic ring protein SteA [Aeromicrobium duanguangcaii]